MVILVFITASDSSEAEHIGKTLVKERLAACANVIESVKSHYWWKGEIEESAEAMLILKTTERKLEDIFKRVGELHSYENPEVIAVPILRGKKEYMDWIKEELFE